MKTIKHNKELNWNFVFQTERSHRGNKYARGPCGFFYVASGQRRCHSGKPLLQDRRRKMERREKSRQNISAVTIFGEPPENKGQVRITSGTLVDIDTLLPFGRPHGGFSYYIQP